MSCTTALSVSAASFQQGASYPLKIVSSDGGVFLVPGNVRQQRVKLYHQTWDFVTGSGPDAAKLAQAEFSPAFCSLWESPAARK